MHSHLYCNLLNTIYRNRHKTTKKIVVYKVDGRVALNIRHNLLYHQTQQP